MYTDRPELWSKLNSLVNKYGGDRAFADHIDEVPRTVKELVYSDPKLMERFGFSPAIPTDNGSGI